MSLGSRIKELRLNKNMTQEDLGKILGVSKVSISGYENGTREPDTQSLLTIAKHFGVSTDYLLGKTNSKSVDNIQTADLDDDMVIKTFEGKPIPPEDMELIKRLLRGKE